MKYWLSCLLCGLKRKLNKDGYCKECQKINDVIQEVRKDKCSSCKGTKVVDYGKFYGKFPCPKCNGTGKVIEK